MTIRACLQSEEPYQESLHLRLYPNSLKNQ